MCALEDNECALILFGTYLLLTQSGLTLFFFAFIFFEAEGEEPSTLRNNSSKLDAFVEDQFSSGATLLLFAAAGMISQIPLIALILLWKCEVHQSKVARYMVMPAMCFSSSFLGLALIFGVRNEEVWAGKTTVIAAISTVIPVFLLAVLVSLEWIFPCVKYLLNYIIEKVWSRKMRWRQAWKRKMIRQRSIFEKDLSDFEVGSAEEEEECPICLHEHDLNATLECGHRYHQVCIDKWRAFSTSSTCPLCKSPIRLRIVEV